MTVARGRRGGRGRGRGPPRLRERLGRAPASAIDVSDVGRYRRVRPVRPGTPGRVRALFADLVARRRLSVSLELRTRGPTGRDRPRAAGRQPPRRPGRRSSGDPPRHHGPQEPRAALHEVDRRQNALVESLADGLVMVDADGTVVRVNEAFEVMFRAPRVRILGEPFQDDADVGGRTGPRGIRRVRRRAADRGEHPLLVALRRGRRVGRRRHRLPRTAIGQPAGSGSAPRPSSGRTER